MLDVEAEAYIRLRFVYGCWSDMGSEIRNLQQIDHITKDGLSKDILGGTFKAALETRGQKWAEE